ncbi:MAG: STAS domain-containing protein [Verrucomicrobiales bacterium]|nr:STAS domain-containing protein [Verrucomicrobiales bacterium]
MNLAPEATILQVRAPDELNASNAGPFRDLVRNSLKPEHQKIDLDFSATRFVDSSGLGALISLHKAMVSRSGGVRVMNPTLQVQQILELTRMHRLFEIIRA